MAGQLMVPKREHCLIIEDGKGQQQLILRKSAYTLGRANDCDICLRSQFVSRHHATLYRKTAKDGLSYYQIIDGDAHGKPSVNGLLINGVKANSHNLEQGDEVTFGPQVFAIYQHRQLEQFPTMPTHDPFDITLINPSMLEHEDEQLEHD